jgi:hypothetical protein
VSTLNKTIGMGGGKGSGSGTGTGALPCARGHYCLAGTTSANQYPCPAGVCGVLRVFCFDVLCVL